MAFADRIHTSEGYHKSGYDYYPVLIIGAGESGLAMGCRLREKLGFDQFRIFDRQSGIGGKLLLVLPREAIFQVTYDQVLGGSIVTRESYVLTLVNVVVGFHDNRCLRRRLAMCKISY